MCKLYYFLTTGEGVYAKINATDALKRRIIITGFNAALQVAGDFLCYCCFFF